MLTRLLYPRTYRRPDEPATGGAAAPTATEPAAAGGSPAAEGAGPPPQTPPAAAPAATPAAAPWAKDLEQYVTDPAAREAFDRYMREKQQPYVTKLEQDKADLEGKVWVFDGLQEDPEATLREIAEQVYDADTAARIAELLMEGKTPEGAEAQATAEAAGAERAPAAAKVDDLSKLPAEVREAVEFAKAEKARREAEDAQKIQQEQLDKAMKEYDTWRAEVLAKPEHAHVVEAALHAFVHAADGDMEQGLANYLATFPAPEGAVKPTPPPTLGGHTTGGIRPSRQVSSLGDAFGEVYDAAHKGTTTL